MKENIFDSLLIEMRHIDGKKPDTAFTLYGERFRTPVMTAALSHLDEVCPNGMTELARGAAIAGAVSWIDMGEKEELLKIAGTGAKFIEIIKPFADNDLILERISHAEKCGALAVGLDIAYAFDESGEYAQVRGYDMKPKSREEIRKFAASTSLPFIVKGVLGARDAYKALEAGALGIMVSHHPGSMDYALPPLVILPEILKVINGQIPVFVDCGITSGVDAFKALALGASAVCAGSVLLPSLKEAGAQGVAMALSQMNDELKGVMARTGCYDLKHMDQTVLHKI